MAAILKELAKRRKRAHMTNYPNWTLDACKKRINTWFMEHGSFEGFWEAMDGWITDSSERWADEPLGLEAIRQCEAMMTLAWDELFPTEKPTASQLDVNADDIFSILDTDTPLDLFSALDGERAS